MGTYRIALATVLHLKIVTTFLPIQNKKSSNLLQSQVLALTDLDGPSLME